MKAANITIHADPNFIGAFAEIPEHDCPAKSTHNLHAIAVSRIQRKGVELSIEMLTDDSEQHVGLWEFRRDAELQRLTTKEQMELEYDYQLIIEDVIEEGQFWVSE